MNDNDELTDDEWKVATFTEAEWFLQTSMQD